MTEDEANAAISAAPFTATDPIRQFDAEVPTGTVIDALAADGSSLTGVATYGELQPVTLLVSVGPLPDVAGMSVEDATNKLNQVGLAAGAINAADFSDTVPEGAVVRIQPRDDKTVVRDGDTVDLITSKGIEQVAVPDVVGMSWYEAKPILEAAGFDLDYNIFADSAPSLFTVSKIKPDAGTLVDKGSTVKINFSS